MRQDKMSSSASCVLEFISVINTITNKQSMELRTKIVGHGVGQVGGGSPTETYWRRCWVFVPI